MEIIRVLVCLMISMLYIKKISMTYTTHGYPFLASDNTRVVETPEFAIKRKLLQVSAVNFLSLLICVYFSIAILFMIVGKITYNH